MSADPGKTNQNWLNSKSDEELLDECVKAHDDGTLIRDKHDPDEFHAGRTETTYRTVVSDEAKASLAEDLKNKAYEVEVYHDAKYDSQIASLIPKPDICTLAVQGSGIHAYDIVATSVQDSLVVAYDQIGPKVFAEDRSVFKSALHQGKPRFTRIHRSQNR